MIKKNTILVSYCLITTLMVLLHFYYDPVFTFVHVVTHLSAILGITALFFAIMIPLFKKRLSLPKSLKIITLHHFFSYIAWICMIVHMIFLSIKFNKWSVLLPLFDPWHGIFTKGGPIAFILFIIAGFGLFFRKRWKTFKAIHSINIVAFIWISSHGILKDNGLTPNYPQYILLILLNIIILVVLINNSFTSKKSMSR